MFFRAVFLGPLAVLFYRSGRANFGQMRSDSASFVCADTIVCQKERPTRSESASL